MGKKNLIVRIAIIGRKHPKHRKFFIVLLAGAVLLHMIRKRIAKVMPKAREWAVAAVAMSVIVVGFSTNLTDGAATPYPTVDVETEAEGFATSLDFLTNGTIELEAKVSEDMLPQTLQLINKNNPLDPSYVPKMTSIGGGYQVNVEIYEPLMDMLNAGWKQGLNLMVCSTYRSYDRQTELFNDAVSLNMKSGMTKEEAEDYASFSYSAPGASEHQMAIAVDIVSRYHQSLDNAFANTAEAKWLYDHCAEYGFILRYPQDKTDITGIKYEPWHFRYVGTEAAKTIMEEGLTLEEYLLKYYPEYCNCYVNF